MEGAGVEFSGVRLRGFRRGRGLTQPELCERADMSENTLRGLEHGSRRPTDGEVARLARALDISVSDLESIGTYSEDCADVRAQCPPAARGRRRPPKTMEPWPGFQDEITRRVEARLFAAFDESAARLQAVIDEGRALVASCEDVDPSEEPE